MECKGKILYPIHMQTLIPMNICLLSTRVFTHSNCFLDMSLCVLCMIILGRVTIIL